MTRTPPHPASLLLVLGVIGVAVAGCTAGPSPPTAPSSPMAAASSESGGPGAATSSSPSTAESGEIQGTVVDDAQSPVGNVSVSLDGDAQTTTSRDDGSFVLRYVDPGAHDLLFRRDGFVEQTKRVTVDAGATTRVPIVLVPAASAADFVETLHKTGFVLCGAAVRVPTAGNVGTSVCNPLGVDQFKLTYTVPTWENVTGVWLETTWRSTQALGDGLQANWWVKVPGGALNGYLAIVNGTSPLSKGVSRQALEDFYVYVNKKGLDQCSTDKGCGLEAWHFAYASTLGPTSLVDASILLNQAYDEYVSIFHRVPFPETFTALPPS